MLKTRSVWSDDRPGDGLRILVTRVRGRGLPKTSYDVWMASLGPSERLLRDQRISWAEFKRRYVAEILDGGSADKGNEIIKNHGQKFALRLIKHLAQRQNVTLMCHCDDDQDQCHRHVLKKLIESGRV